MLTPVSVISALDALAEYEAEMEFEWCHECGSRKGVIEGKRGALFCDGCRSRCSSCDGACLCGFDLCADCEADERGKQEYFASFAERCNCGSILEREDVGGGLVVRSCEQGHSFKEAM